MKTITIEDPHHKMSIEEQLNLTVKKSNDLVRESRHQLSAKELTLVDFMISKHKDSASGLLQIQTTIAEINSVCNFGEGGNNQKSTEEALINLSVKSFEVTTKTGWRTIARWLEKPLFKNGEVILQLDKDLLPELPALVNKPGTYTQYYFKDSVNLKQINAKRLYEFLRSYDAYQVVEVPKRKIMVLFQKEDMEWYRFTKYLRNAVTAINSHTSMDLSYQTIKEGRETVTIRFKILKREHELILNK